jgi:hypothetical protein
MVPFDNYLNFNKERQRILDMFNQAHFNVLAWEVLNKDKPKPLHVLWAVTSFKKFLIDFYQKALEDDDSYWYSKLTYREPLARCIQDLEGEFSLLDMKRCLELSLFWDLVVRKTCYYTFHHGPLKGPYTTLYPKPTLFNKEGYWTRTLENVFMYQSSLLSKETLTILHWILPDEGKAAFKKLQLSSKYPKGALTVTTSNKGGVSLV